MIEFLASWGFRYEQQSQPQHALPVLKEAAAAGDPFRVALIHEHLPGLASQELGAAIAGDPQLAATTAVLMTLLGEELGEEQLRQFGFAAQVSKPIWKTNLFDCLTGALEGRKAPLHPAADSRSVAVVRGRTLTARAGR